MAEGTWAKTPLSNLPEPPRVPRRDKGSAYKDDVVLGYVTHLAHPLPLSFRALRVIRDMNETFQAPAGGKPAHTRCSKLSDLPKDMQPVPEAGIPTTEHLCCSAVQAVASSHHHHHLSLHRACSLLPRLSKRKA